uniref:Uncharacterized protein n=1 Tax=Trichogramma kaykai TaxID=54128 RepID=A0ABD2W678_9HYME
MSVDNTEEEEDVFTIEQESNVFNRRFQVNSLQLHLRVKKPRHGENLIDIRSFVSGGPKFYAYQVVTPDTGAIHETCKVKGIRLNYKNSQKINYTNVREMILKLYNSDEDDDNSISLGFKSIRRTKTHEVITVNETKTRCPVLKKRIFLKPELSLPFGYVK